MLHFTVAALTLLICAVEATQDKRVPYGLFSVSLYKSLYVLCHKSSYHFFIQTYNFGDEAERYHLIFCMILTWGRS